MLHPSVLINGSWHHGLGPRFSKFDPLDESLLWQSNSASASDVGLAVDAARAAFPAWARRPLAERQAVLARFAGLLGEHQSALAQVISRETGKPTWEALTEVQTMINKVAISLQAYQERTGERSAAMADGAAVLRHRPHGVLAVFGPL